MIPTNQNFRVKLLVAHRGGGGAATFLRYLEQFYLEEGFHADKENLPDIPAVKGSLPPVRGVDSSEDAVPPDFTNHGLREIQNAIKRLPIFLYRTEWIQLGDRLLQDRAHYDLVVVSTTLPGRLSGLKLGKTPVLFVHHSYPVGWKHFAVGWFFGLKHSRYAHRVYVSNFSKRRFQRYWFLTERTRDRVIKNTGGQPLQRALAHPKAFGKRTVLTVAGMHSWKDPDLWFRVVLRAYLDGNPHRLFFVWVGDGPELERIQGLLVRHQLLDIAAAVGHRRSVEEFYIGATLYLHTARRESLGLAAVDAQRFGLPIVARRVGGVPEVCVHKKTGWLVSGRRPKALMRGIKWFLEDEETYSQASRDSVENYRLQFSFDVWKTSFLKLHNELLQMQ